MASQFHYDRMAFQMFVNDNFATVKTYLTQGVYDRRKIMRIINYKSRYANCKTYYNDETSVGDIWTDQSKKKYICLVKLPENSETSVKIPKGGDFLLKTTSTKKHSFIFSRIKSDNSKDGYNVSYRNLSGNTVFGEIVAETNENGKTYTNHYFSYSICFTPTDEEIWDSFFTLYSIASYASGKRITDVSAEYDFQEAAKLVTGLEANPLRFMLSLGDQYLRYIFEAFGLNNVDRKNSANDITQDDRLTYLRDLINYHKTPQSQYIISCNNIVQLLYLNKELRNKEAHSQIKWSDPTDLIRWFLLDHVMLVYMLKYILRANLSSNCCTDALKENLYFPVRTSENISVENTLKIGDVFYVAGYAEYKVDGKIQQIKDLSISGINYRKESDILEVKKDLLPIINRINYNPVIESLQVQIAALRASSATREELDKVKSLLEDKDNKALIPELREWNQRIEEIATENKEIRKNLTSTQESLSKFLSSHKEADDLIKSVNEVYKKNAKSLETLCNQFNEVNNVTDEISSRIKKFERQIKKHKIYIFSIITILVFVFSCITACLFIANSHDLAIKNDFCYKISNYINNRGDISYERGRYLDAKITKNLLNHQFLSSQDSLFIALNPLRSKAAEAYHNASISYRHDISEKKSDIGKAAYRQALMLMEGRGGEYNWKDASHYANIAAEHNIHAMGLAETLNFLVTDSIKYLRRNLSRLRNAESEDCFAPIAVGLYDLEKDSQSEIMDSVKLAEAMEKIVKTYSAHNDAHDLAGQILASIMLYGYNNFNDSKSLYNAYRLMTDLSAYNSPILQFLLGDYFDALGLTEIALPQLMAAYNNRYDLAGIQAMNLIERTGTSENEIIRKYPEIRKLSNHRNLFKEFSEISGSFSSNSPDEIEEKLDWLETLNLPHNMHLIVTPHAKEFMKLGLPDSAKYILDNFDSFSIAPDINFISEPDSLEKRNAVCDYLTALFYYEGLGHRKQDTEKADSFMRSSAEHGLVDAIITYAQKLYGDGKSYTRGEEAIDWMEKAAPYSDDAKIWLAERYRLTNPNISRKWTDAINDSLNLYKIMRGIDRLNLQLQSSNTDKETHEIVNKKFRLYNLLNRAIQFRQDVSFLPNTLAHIMAYLALASAAGNQDESLFYETISSRLSMPTGIMFLTLREKSRPGNPGAYKNLVKFAGYIQSLENTELYEDYSPWLRDNISSELKGTEVNLITKTLSYPDIIWDDFGVSIPEYTPISKLIEK